MNRPKIKFSHSQYAKFNDKLRHGDVVLLCGVFRVHTNSLPPDFLEFDTRYYTAAGKEHYLLDDGSYLLLLFFNKEHELLFTTIRRFTTEKEEYYRGLRGSEFTIEIKEAV